jgi:hypothetical protein
MIHHEDQNMQTAYNSIKNTDVLDGNLTVHLLIVRCYQKYGTVLIFSFFIS